jgi:streptogramin lyase
VSEFDAGGDGWAMTKAGGALWIQVDPPVDAIVRIDIKTGVAVPAIPGGVKVKFGKEGLWVACCDGIARVDPATGEQLLLVPLDGAFALANGSVFTLSGQGLQALDPQTGVAVGEPVGSAVDPTACFAWKDLIVAFGSAWLACKEGKVVRIDLDGGRSTSITTQAGAHTFAVTEDAIWVTNYQAGSVSRIDPQTDQVTTIQGAGSGVGITTGGGYVWAAAANGIAKIDPATRSIVAMIDLGPGDYYELVWDEGVIWVSTRGSRVLKVDPSATP